MKYLFLIIAFVLRIRAVVLIDSWEDEYLSFERKRIVAGNWAYVYPFVKVGTVNLRSDGTCDGTSCYIKTWRYL